MANEFIARKGLIVPTGSINVIDGDVTASNFLGTASAAISSSFATTASFALSTTAGQGFPFSGSAVITGSLDVTQAVTASFFKGDGSQLTNIGSISAVAIDAYEFIGDGSTINYILSRSYGDASLFVTVDGLGFNTPSDYSIVDSTIIFTSAPPSESVIYIKGLKNTGDDPSGSFTGSFSGSFTGTFTQVPNISIVADNHLFVGDGTTVNYILSQSYSPSILTVSTDGLVNALTEDYTVTGTQLSFIFAPPSASNILVKGIRLNLT
jgi:hypothetical protein